jgi:hypothetical protein
MTATRSESVYPSKRDWWLALLLWGTVVVMVFTAILVVRAPESLGAKLVAVALCFATVAFLLWTLYGTYYVISDERLVVRSGPFRWRIALDAIQAVEPSRSPLSSPALSLDRLRIRHGPRRRSILISPDEQQQFLWDLSSRTPGLTLRGDRAVRE